MIDFLIVGGGYAGSMLANALLKRKFSVKVFDDEFEKSPSSITSGIINPVTGRNLVKSWRFNEFRNEAVPFYNALQDELGFALIDSLKMCRILQNPREWNEYSSRKMMAEYSDVLGEELTFNTDKYYPTEGFEIKEAYRVHIPEICKHYSRIFKEQHVLVQEKFLFERLIQNENAWSYGDIQAKKIVFCEGAKGKQNPFFSHIQYILAAGEFLMVEIQNLNQAFILSQHKALVPYGSDLYWFGATFRWDMNKPVITDEGKEELIMELEKIIKLPYHIRQHGGAIRPTIKDRRPVMGAHQDKKGLYIFNGFGTKAASLMPFYVTHFCDVLEGNKKVEKEVCHTRFL